MIKLGLNLENTKSVFTPAVELSSYKLYWQQFKYLSLLIGPLCLSSDHFLSLFSWIIFLDLKGLPIMTTVSLKKYRHYILYEPIIITIMIFHSDGTWKKSWRLEPETAAHHGPKPTKVPVCLIVAHVSPPARQATPNTSLTHYRPQPRLYPQSISAVRTAHVVPAATEKELYNCNHICRDAAFVPYCTISKTNT